MSVAIQPRGASLGTVGLIFVVVACSGAPATTQGESATTTSGEVTSTAGSMPTTSTDGMSSTSAATTTTTTSTTAGESTSCVSSCDLDVGSACGPGEVFCCDPWLQDCPEGEKCNAWANDGAWQWNSNKCVPVDPDPDAVGEPCTVVENGVSGLDSCDYGAMCWSVDPETNTGTCIALCVGSEEQCSQDPASCCPPGSSCTLPSGGNLILCLATCHPLIQNCGGVGEICYPVGASFQCAPDDSGDLGQPGDPCEYINTCDPGMYCGDPSTYPGCDLMAGGCCIPFCDLNDPECVPGTECQPWYDPRETPPSYEGLGACVIP